MRSTLLKSVINFTLFWWVVGFVAFSLAEPPVNAAVLQRLADFLAPHILIEVPEKVSILDALGMQVDVLRYWTLPFGALAAGIFTGGYVLSWLIAAIAQHKRKVREKGKGGWRGMSVTLGEFPVPVAPARTPIQLKAAGVVAQGLAQMPPAVRQLTQEILEILAAHPNAYTGDGHGGITLLEHTLNVMRRGFDVEAADPLLPAVLAGHDLGKITAFMQRGDEWLVVKPHDKESARLIALLPSYAELCEEDRKLVTQAIRYSHSVWNAPHDGVDMERLKRLIEQMKQADGEATSEEKQDVLEKLPLPQLAFRTFMSLLPELPFQEPGLPRNVQAAGWRVDNRVYLLENKVRDAAIDRLDKHTAAALGGKHREQGNVHKFTANLLMAFDEAGWLVKKVGKARTPVEEALWRIKAGSKPFQGVIILDLPEDKLSLLPKHNTIYEITVLSQQFPPKGSLSSANISLAGILGGGEPGKDSAATKPEARSESGGKPAGAEGALKTEQPAPAPRADAVKPAAKTAQTHAESESPAAPAPVEAAPVSTVSPVAATPASAKPTQKRKERRLPTAAPTGESDAPPTPPEKPPAAPVQPSIKSAEKPSEKTPDKAPAPKTPKPTPGNNKPSRGGFLPGGLLK